MSGSVSPEEASKAPIGQCEGGNHGDREAFEDYIPLNKSMKEIRDAIPSHLLERKTLKGLSYVARDVIMVVLFFYGATLIEPTLLSPSINAYLGPDGVKVARRVAWGIYWWFQGLAMTGLWVLAHESGHLAISPSKTLCHTIGFTLHSFLLVPYFSWKYTHRTHHSYHNNLDKDSYGLPDTRSDLDISSEEHGPTNYNDFFEDTPIVHLYYLIRRQLVGLHVYLLFDISGQKRFKGQWSSHFNPNCPLFTPQQRKAVIASDIGVMTMGGILTYAIAKLGARTVFKYYGLPWILVGHWITMIVYLHHTDPRTPRFRSKAWTFQAGAAATVDRDFLGWQGRFFLHDISHYHVIHHYFPTMPFYNGEEATKYLKEILGSHYMRSSEPVFKSLWKCYRQCKFIEDEGPVVFYKDLHGKSARKLAKDYEGWTRADSRP